MKPLKSPVAFGIWQPTIIISQYLARKLKLKEIGTNNLSFNTFGTTKAENLDTPIVKFRVMVKCGFVMKLQAKIVPEVTKKTERGPIESENIKAELMKSEFAHNLPTTIEMSRVDILIGNDYYTDTVSMKRVEITNTLHHLGSRMEGQKPTNLLTKTWWCWQITLASHHNLKYFWSIFKGQQINYQQYATHLKEFWKLKTVGIKETCKETANDKAQENFNQTVEHKEGRYCVQWTWKEDNQGSQTWTWQTIINGKTNGRRRQDIWSNSTRSIEEGDDWEGRFNEMQSCVGALDPRPCFDKAELQHNESENCLWHICKNEESKQKPEECIYRGPVTLEDLRTWLLRFWKNKIAVAAYIEKAFLQI